MEKCLWCQRPIEQNFLARRGGLTVPYQACDKDCAHGIDVLEKLDLRMFKVKRPILNEHIICYEGDDGYDAIVTECDYKKKAVTVKYEDDTTTVVAEEDIEYIPRLPIEDEPIVAFV